MMGLDRIYLAVCILLLDVWCFIFSVSFPLRKSNWPDLFSSLPSFRSYCFTSLVTFDLVDSRSKQPCGSRLTASRHWPGEVTLMKADSTRCVLTQTLLLLSPSATASLWSCNHAFYRALVWGQCLAGVTHAALLLCVCVGGWLGVAVFLVSLS